MRNILRLTEFEDDDRVPEESWAATLLRLAALLGLALVLGGGLAALLRLAGP